ncbi:MAG: hypothetical protein ABTD50_16385 [Polyangiaceae bacterium]|jgi:hypothetical protein
MSVFTGIEDGDVAKMGTNTFPQPECASGPDIDAAIRSLSDADGIRLQRAASFRARGLAALGLGISPADLLQDAISRTIAGDRKWKKGITFVKHLLGTMRSIANHAKDELKGGTVVPSTSDDHTGGLDGVILRARTGHAELVVAADEQLASIMRRFGNDDEVGLVLEELATGMSGPEIQKDLGLTQTQYETIMTRLRRGVDREKGWRP